MATTGNTLGPGFKILPGVAWATAGVVGGAGGRMVADDFSFGTANRPKG